MLQKYKRRIRIEHDHEVIEAVQFTDKNKDQVYNWAREIQGNVYHSWIDKSPCLVVPNELAEPRCRLGDYLTKAVFPTDQRKFTIFRKEDFESEFQRKYLETEEKDNKVLFYWENRVLLGYAYREVDGFYVFSFESNSGTWSSYVLREIADKLDELNKDWSQQLEEYFKNEESKQNGNKSDIDEPGTFW